MIDMSLIGQTMCRTMRVFAVHHFHFNNPKDCWHKKRWTGGQERKKLASCFVQCLIMKKHISSLCVKWPDTLSFLSISTWRETSTAAQNLVLHGSTSFVSLWHQSLMTNKFQAFAASFTSAGVHRAVRLQKKKKENVFFCSTFFIPPRHQGQTNFLKRCEKLQVAWIWHLRWELLKNIIFWCQESHSPPLKKRPKVHLPLGVCWFEPCHVKYRRKWNYEGQKNGEERVHCVSGQREKSTQQRAAATGEGFSWLL